MGFKQWFNRSRGQAPVKTGTITPPPRQAAPVTSLPAVYRAIQVITNAVAQLPLYARRAGRRLDWSQTPGVLKHPSLDISRSEFIEQLVMSMCLRGNAYFIAEGEYRGAAANLTVLSPDRVTVAWNRGGTGPEYFVDGKKIPRARIGHAALFRGPGQLTGLGPIAAARVDLEGAAAVRDYATNYFVAGQPAGILSTDQALTGGEADQILKAWNYLDVDGNPVEKSSNPSRARVLPRGIKYQPLLVAPKDAQWLEARAFNTTEIARLFGVPAALLLAAVDGTSQTYSNIEQAWIEFSRFTLTMYTRKIEAELSRMLPGGMDAQFNFEGLLRPDTKTRYEAYQTALNGGFMTVNEVRALEDRDPLEEGKQSEQD